MTAKTMHERSQHINNTYSQSHSAASTAQLTRIKVRIDDSSSICCVLCNVSPHEREREDEDEGEGDGEHERDRVPR
jgi:hypothetical protein